MSIRARLLLLILFATLVPAMFGVLKFRERRDAEIAMARRALATSAQRGGLALSDTVRATAQLLFGLSRARDLDTQDRAACSNFLANVLKEHPQYTSLLTIKPDGSMFCDSLRTGRTLNLADRRYFQGALRPGNSLAVEPVFGQLTGRAVLQIAHAVRRADGEPDFVLLASLDLDKYMQSYAKFLLRETVVIALLDNTGNVLTWHPEVEKRPGTSLAASPLSEFARQHHGGAAREIVETDGSSRIWAAGALPGFPLAGLYVLVGVSEQELLALANRTFGQGLLILTLVSLLAFAGGWVLVESSIRRPVARIVAAVGRFSGGDFDARVGRPYSRGEIGRLMAALDQSFDLTQTVHRRVVRSAEVLGHANRALQILSQSDKALVHAHEEEALLRDQCRVVTRWGGYRRCWVGYVAQDGARSIHPMAQVGFEDDWLETLGLTWAEQARCGSPFGRAIRDGAPVLEKSLPSDPEARSQRAAQEGDAALIVLPIKINGNTMGVLAVYAAEPECFDEREVRLLAELAADLGYGIQALRNRVELDRHRLQLEKLVEQRTAELVESHQELESFSYSVSHDLRAPLRHVQGYAELLGADAASTLSPESRRYLQVIAGAGQEMGDLVDNLLAVLRMNRAAMHESRVDLEALARGAIRDLGPGTQGRNIVWKVAPLPPVLGDAAMLRQVLVNLLGNAVKYTRRREAAQIEIGTAGDEDGRMVVFVRDNGVGFDMEYADKLFGVFQRLHRADEFEGTGIGLATVRRIIARHGGRVWAEGRPSEGATFYFTLGPAHGPLAGRNP